MRKITTILGITLLVATLMVGISGIAQAQTYVYSNGGNYWSVGCYAEDCIFWLTWDQGFCCKYAEWCSPCYMQWTYNVEDPPDHQDGKWRNGFPDGYFRYDYQGSAYAFIPCVDATTQSARYWVQRDDHYDWGYCNGQNVVGVELTIVNQLGYSDTWVSARDYSWQCLYGVKLGDWTNEPDYSRRVGYDEVKIEY
ncbi:MAG: hypothetical protein ACKKMP_03670 [Candidatus Nealsonbacteria bacterium]